MIDRLLSKLGQKSDIIVDPNYNPAKAVVSVQRLSSSDNKLAVLFPPWHGGGIYYRRLMRRLNKKGWSVIAYQFSPQILEAEDKAVLSSFQHIRDDIVSKLKEIPEDKYEQIKFISLSLGTVPMTLVADKFRDFTSAIIVVGGDDLATDTWHSIRTADIRKEFEHEHIGIRKLGKEWYSIAPKQHVQNFNGKRVKFVLSTKDQIIRTKYQWHLIEALKDAGAELTVKKSHIGHIPTTVLFCLFGRLS